MINGEVQMKMEKREFDVVGKPLPRVDGKVKVTGTAIFADDINMPAKDEYGS